MTYPYNDDVMVYDYDKHRYFLTEKGVLSELGINLSLKLKSDSSDVNVVSRFLRKVTNAVYKYIFEDSSSVEWQEYIMAVSPYARPIVEEMLLEQCEYALDNNFIEDFSGVNIAKGSAMKLSDLRGEAKVADRVVTLAQQEIRGVPFPLKSAFVLPDVPDSLYHAGY